MMGANADLSPHGEARASDANSCPRPATGSVVTPPPDLWSRDGALNVTFNYYTTLDDAGRTLFCFVTANGLESPTLHLSPGDTLNAMLTNSVPPAPATSPIEVVSNSSNRCGAVTMTLTSVNLHFHGTNTSPKCHSDEAIHTLVNSGETFQYSVTIPSDEPPGLYWYHPHVHGMSEAAVQGGASGAIIVEGIANLQPAVSGLPERLLLIRDQNVAGNPQESASGGPVPGWDVTLNYVPIAYPAEVPAIIQSQSGQQEFWRVVNASADTILDLQLLYDGAEQPLRIVALDGVPLGSQDGTRQGRIVTDTHMLLPPAARAEFIVTAPSHGVQNASFITRNINTGPDGDNDPIRTLATIEITNRLALLPLTPSPDKHWRLQSPQRFEGLSDAEVTASRSLYFSELLSDPSDPNSPTNFFITVDGAAPTLFDPNLPPAIVTHQGAVEDWIIQNRSLENHEFHIHQIHFLLLQRDGQNVPAEEQQFRDMVQVPFWSGSGPYPSVKVRMDFRGPDVGDFVYHCHILGHEDGGMMAIVRVLERH
jgi:FtsP/CotA-like multicopper oxidase with cupredoxin domain